ncbi:hypothetical protein Tco_0939387 [Tanacetum coccineum]|uniref:Reverse transcriptase domain-containing protein n=1 Tax=Tanacetum coccineum TaxID=301880 RepID=A0ABQ5DKG9_9ASTR
MSSYTHPSIPFDYDVNDAFSSINAPNYTPISPDYSRDFFPPGDILPPKDTKTPVESPIPVSPSSSVGSSSPVRSTTPPPDSPLDDHLRRAAIRQLIADGIAAALKAQAATMANTNSTESVFSSSKCVKEDRVTFATVKKMEDEFYNLVVKGNDLKTYVRIFQELAVLCSNMVPNTEKLMEVFTGVLPRSIEGNVTASSM